MVEDLAAARNTPAADKARAWLAGMRAKVPVAGDLKDVDRRCPLLATLDKRLDGKDLEAMRARAAEFILALRGE